MSKVTEAWLAAKAVVPGEVTVIVHFPAPFAAMTVLPLIRQGPVSERLVGAPDPVVVNNWRLAFAGTETVAPACHAALPWTPNEIGSAASAGSTLMI